MIHYIEGDATEPHWRPMVIAHICNNRGGWGKGFVKAISKRWKAPEQEYRLAAKAGELQLGAIQIVLVEDNLWVANLVAQDGYASARRPCALDYAALQRCLRELARWCRECDVLSIAMPRIGTGLAGGDWDVIEPIIDNELDYLRVCVYDLKAKQ